MAGTENRSIAGLRMPEPLAISDKMGPSWLEWKQRYEWYALAAKLNLEAQPVQVAVFMSAIGAEHVKIFETLGLTDAQKLDYTQVMNAFDARYKERNVLTYERYIFNSIKQQEGETFESFYSELLSKVRTCQYGSLEKSLILDRIVIGVRDNNIRKQLLKDAAATLETAVALCRAHELASEQTANITTRDEGNKPATKEAEINRIKQGKTRWKGSQDNEKRTAIQGGNNDKNCGYCGRRHNKGNCPAYGKECSKCGRSNHFANVCKTSSKNRQQSNDKTVNAINEDSDSSSITDFTVYSIANKNEKSRDKWFVSLMLDGTNVKFRMDSGADANVLPVKYLNNPRRQLKQSVIKLLKGYAGGASKVIGEAKLQCCYRDRKKQITFQVVNEDKIPILSGDACEDLGLLKLINQLVVTEETLKNRINRMSQGLGCVKNYPYDLKVRKDIQFPIRPPRRIPLAVREEAKAYLKKMEDMGVIKPVREPTPIVSDLVVVRQNGKIRPVIDPTDLNSILLRQHHPLQTLDDIAPRFHGSKYFSKLDCKSSFWQIPLTERSMLYTTFNTPWGRYCYTRMPMGISSASEVFQQIVEEILKGIPKVEDSVDDIIIHGADKDEVIQRTNTVLARLEKEDIRLSAEKCKIAQTSVKFLGHIISGDGISVDPDRVEAISNMKEPTNTTELRRLLGVFTYINKFISHYQEITYPLRQLLSADVCWVWENEHKEAFKTLQKALTTVPVLRFFEPGKPIVLSVDASSYATGAVLLQDKMPIAYASKALTPTQQSYAQIEKEALAILMGCHRFHQFLAGREFIVESDHKPLETIMRKPLMKAPPRLQRILLRIQPYAPKVTYKKGKELHMADYLSRDVQGPMMEDDRTIDIFYAIPIREESKERIINEINDDETMKQLKTIILTGWPCEINNVPKAIREFWTFRDELSTHDNIIVKGQQMLIPRKMQETVMKQIHHGHLGINSCLRRARDSVFWPGMTAQINKMVEECEICQSRQKDNAKTPLATKETASRPWQFVASDLFFYQRKPYILIVDEYSGFIDIHKLDTETSHDAINACKRCFAMHGIPEIFLSDNGTQYSSQAFKKFAANWNFKHITSSPHYPQSNGLAEKSVQTIKNLMKKCAADNTDFHMALLNLRNVPRNDDLGSPVQRLFNRRTRSMVPMCKSKLEPTRQNPNASRELQSLREVQKFYADKGTIGLRPLEIGQQVRLRKGPRDWVQGRVEEKVGNSYIIKSGEKAYRRNRVLLAPTKATLQPYSNQEVENEEIKSSKKNEVSEPTDAVQNDTTDGYKNTVIEPPNIKLASQTRSGRVVKPIIRMNL